MFNNKEIDTTNQVDDSAQELSSDQLQLVVGGAAIATAPAALAVGMGNAAVAGGRAVGQAKGK